MIAFKKKKTALQLSRSEALKCRPVKSDAVIEGRSDSDYAIIQYPIILKPWFHRLIQRLGYQPAGLERKKLELDAMGTAVWDLVDGDRTVKQIVRAFADKHRLQPREAEVAVTQFLRELGRRGVIGLT